MVRQGPPIAVVVTFLIGCAVLLLVVGCAGTSSESSNKKEQGSSPQATESEEEARCEGTQDIKKPSTGQGVFTTNDIPDCVKGGLLKGTDKPDKLAGEKGDDEIRGLGARDFIFGGSGNDIIYGGEGADGCTAETKVRMFSTAEMVTMSSRRGVAGDRTSSIAVKAGTYI